MINSRHTTHGDVEAADFVQRHSFLITPLALVSNCTRRIKGSGADGLLSEDERTELKHACAVFGVAWKASYDRPLTPNGHIVVAWCRGSWTSAASVASSGRMAARRFTCWTRSAVRSHGKCATPRPATKRTPFTALRARLPQSLIAAPTRAERGAAAILVLARERGVETEVATNYLVSR